MMKLHSGFLLEYQRATQFWGWIALESKFFAKKMNVDQVIEQAYWFRWINGRARM